MEMSQEEILRRMALGDLRHHFLDSQLIEELRGTSDMEYMRMNPVIISQDGNIIDGANRLASNPNWDTVIKNVSDDRQRLLDRFKLEVHKKSPEARKESLKLTVEGLFKYYLGEGREELREWWKQKELHSEISHPTSGPTMNKAIMTKISEDLGCSIRWIRQFTPDKYKMASKRRNLRNTPSAKLKGTNLLARDDLVYTCPFCGKELKSKYLKFYISTERKHNGSDS